MNEPPDIIGRSYELAEEAERKGEHEQAAGFTALGRMWYLIGKMRLGVALDADEQSEVNDFIAKHGPEQPT